MNTNKLPQHITITMDGDRRWAKQRGLSVTAGHKQTVQVRIEELIKHCVELNIPYVTFWAWTTENWNRPSIEVKAMMQLFRWSLKHKAQKLIDNGARLQVIGDLSGFPQDIQRDMEAMIAKSQINSQITVTFGLNYGGRNEIIRAVNKAIELSAAGPIDEKILTSHLDTAGMPDPDLIIRTGGEQRMSGFMMWESAYSEFYFTETLMPDLTTEKFDQAIEEYQSRARRFGK